MIIKKYTNKWGTKILSLELNKDNNFIITLTRRIYNPQTEITDYKPFNYGNIADKETALRFFEEKRKGFKLRINLLK